MKKKIIGLLLLAGAAIALIAAAIVLKREKKPEPEAAGYFTVMQIDTEKLDRIVMKNEKLDAEFCYEDGCWIRQDVEFFPVKQQTVLSLIQVLLSNLNAFSKVEQADDLAAYGLKTPQAELTAYAGEEVLCTIYLGNPLPTKDQYYCQFAGDDTVYAVSANYHEYMCRSKDAFLADIDLPVISDVSCLREVVLKSGDSIQLRAVYDEDNPLDYSGKKLFYWKLYEPFQGVVNADFIALTWYQQMSFYLSVPYEQLVAYRPKDLSVYGLDQPEAELLVRYTNLTGTENNQYHLLFGKETEEGKRFAMVEGSEWVLLLSKSAAQSRLDCKPMEWSYLTTFYPGVNLLESILIESGDRVWQLQNTDAAEEGESTYTVNGIRWKEDTLQQFTSEVLKLKYTSFCKLTAEELKEEAVLSITVAAKEPLEGMVIQFYPYTASEYAVSVNGLVNYLIDIRLVQNFLDYMKQYEA